MLRQARKEGATPRVDSPAMSAIGDALIPLTLSIALGFILKRSGFLPDPFWAGLDRLNYWVLFPALIFVTLAAAPTGVAAGPIVLAVWGGLLTVTGLSFLAWRISRVGGPAFTSLLQGSIRFNSFAAFGTIPVLYPEAGALTALLVASTVPLVNVICVLMLARYASGTTVRSVRLARSIATNPLIVASILGLGWQGLGWDLGPLEGGLRLFGSASLGTGLLSVGASLTFTNVRAGVVPIALATLLKFVALPVATALFAVLLGVPREVLPVLLLFQALPTASAAYVLARAMGGDAPLVAAILAVQTVLALFWLPLMLGLVAGG
jgi:malonate transporter and related proteins